MPRTRRTKKEIAQNDLYYLAGIFESTLGLKGPGTQGAAGVSDTEDWPREMAKTFGGYHEQFQARKTEKWYWGWYVPLERRLELLNILEESGVTKSYSREAFEKSRHRIEKAINSQHEKDRRTGASDEQTESSTRKRLREEWDERHPKPEEF